MFQVAHFALNTQWRTKIPHFEENHWKHLIFTNFFISKAFLWPKFLIMRSFKNYDFYYVWFSWFFWICRIVLKKFYAPRNNNFHLKFSKVINFIANFLVSTNFLNKNHNLGLIFGCKSEILSCPSDTSKFLILSHFYQKA